MNTLSSRTTVAFLACTMLTVTACNHSERGETASSVTSTVTTTKVASTQSTPGAGTLADLTPIGLPIYPNVYESGWTGNFSDDKQAARIGQMSSHDAFDKVYGWYSERMPAGSETKEAAASNHTTDEGDRMAVFEVGTTADASMTRVLLIRDKADDHTIINLSGHTTK